MKEQYPNYQCKHCLDWFRSFRDMAFINFNFEHLNVCRECSDRRRKYRDTHVLQRDGSFTIEPGQLSKAR